MEELLMRLAGNTCVFQWGMMHVRKYAVYNICGEGKMG